MIKASNLPCPRFPGVGLRMTQQYETITKWARADTAALGIQTLAIVTVLMCWRTGTSLKQAGEHLYEEGDFWGITSMRLGKGMKEGRVWKVFNFKFNVWQIW